VILVLGASAAGLKAAARARRLMPQATITVVDQRTFISYGACGLPYFLSGEIQNLDALRSTSYGTVRDPEYFHQVKNLDVRTGQRILAIDRGAKTVTLESTVSGEQSCLNYDQLVYALGAEPVIPAGIETGPKISAITTPEAALSLRQGLASGSVENCVVIGGGFVGVETTVALADMWGCEVTLLEAADRLLPRMLDAEMSRLVQAELERNDITVRTGVTVSSAAVNDGAVAIELGEGETLKADHAVVAVGVRPRTELARAAGLTLGGHGGLLVDAHLRTSDPAILAAGDCVELVHRGSGQPGLVPLGSLANRQGRVAGDVLAGRETVFPPVVGSSAVKVFDLNVAATGLSEEAATRANLEASAAWGAFGDRTHFYPEGDQLYLKLVHEQAGDRLLGLQAVGPGEIIKRVDVFAALLHHGADLGDLVDLEVCYSPPYNAPLDPLQGLAAATLNTRELGIGQVPPGSSSDDRLILDVRTAEEFAAAEPAPLAGSINIPLEELRRRVDEIPLDRPILVVCARGPRSFEAARILQSHGCRDLVYLAGGVTMRAAAD